MATAVESFTLRGRRVVLLLAGPILGGAERNALDLGRALLAEEAEVTVCALDGGDGRARHEAAEYGLTWCTAPVPWRGGSLAKAASLLRLATRLRRLRPDVVVAATNLPNMAGALTWRVAGAKTFVWTQCDVDGSTRIRPKLFTRAVRSAPLVLTTAFHARDWLVERYGVDRPRVHVIRSEVSLPPPDSDVRTWRRRLDISQGRPVVCMVAHLHRGKDHETLLHAWRSVVDEIGARTRSSPVLVLAGRDAGCGDALKALAFDLDLRSHVRFAGDVQDLSGLLAACDLAVFSTHGECLGRGATEPMHAGLPVVGTDVPGVREAVGEVGVRFLVPRRDPGALADAILRLLADNGLRREVGEAAATLIRSRQSGESTSRRTIDVIARALSEADAGKRP